MYTINYFRSCLLADGSLYNQTEGKKEVWNNLDAR